MVVEQTLLNDWEMTRDPGSSDAARWMAIMADAACSRLQQHVNHTYSSASQLDLSLKNRAHTASDMAGIG